MSGEGRVLTARMAKPRPRPYHGPEGWRAMQDGEWAMSRVRTPFFAGLAAGATELGEPEKGEGGEAEVGCRVVTPMLMEPVREVGDEVEIQCYDLAFRLPPSIAAMTGEVRSAHPVGSVAWGLETAEVRGQVEAALGSQTERALLVHDRMGTREAVAESGGLRPVLGQRRVVGQMGKEVLIRLGGSGGVESEHGLWGLAAWVLAFEMLGSVVHGSEGPGIGQGAIVGLLEDMAAKTHMEPEVLMVSVGDARRLWPEVGYGYRWVQRKGGPVVRVEENPQLPAGLMFARRDRLPAWFPEGTGITAPASLFMSKGERWWESEEQPGECQLRYQVTLRVHVPGAFGMLVSKG